MLSGTDGGEVVFLRVATVGANDRMDKSDLETKVMKASPVFYVYVPGEPYFYASASKPCPDTCEGESKYSTQTKVYKGASSGFLNSNAFY